MRVIDAHVHLVECIAGIGAGGELRGIGGGRARYANGEEIQLLPEQYDHQVTPEDALAVMDANGVEKAVLLQGNYYGFQNLYSAKAMEKYPNRFLAAGSYDPFSRDRDGIRKHLFEDLGIRVEKFEVSDTSGLMSNHAFRLDGELMEEAYSYAEAHHHVFVIDIGKCGHESWQIPALARAVKRHPDMKFVVCHLLACAADQADYLKEGLKTLALPNVWFDLAAVPHNCRPDEFPYPRTMEFLRTAKNIVGADRLIFGTDFPSTLKSDSYDHYIAMIADSDVFTEREKEQILYDTAEEVFFRN